MDPLVVVVYGPVGVGKSTVVEAMREGTGGDVFCIDEPVEAMIESGALEDVYANRSSSGLRLQMLVLAHRMGSYWATASRMANACLPPGARPVVVCDGHLSLDPRIFTGEHLRNGRMSSADHELYSTAISVLLAQSPPFAQRPELYVYLRGSAHECRRRAEERGRSAESTLQLDFFERMVAACEQATRRLVEHCSVNEQLVVVDTDNMNSQQVIEAVRHAVHVHLEASSFSLNV